MNRYLASVSAVALTLMLSDGSLAQTYRDSGGTAVQGVVPVGGNQSGPLFTPGNPGSVTGTFSATFSGFQPTPSYNSESVTTTSAAYALPTGTVVIFYNTGSTAITVKLGSSSISVAANQGDVIQPDSWMAFTVGTATYFAVVGNGGTSSVVASGGAGLPTGAGGGGSGSGAVMQGSPNTVANAWPFAPVVAGAAVSSTNPFPIQGVSGGTAVPVSGTFWQTTQPVSLASLPALSTGSSVIGAVTQSGTWTTGRTWSLSSGLDSVSATISGTPTISGTVTVNAGTNLNTSALALETGGNLASINGKLTTSANGLKVDGSGATQPVSGSVSISGTPSITISGNPVLGAGSNTIGKADILGSSGMSLDSVAGTSNAQAITIQGNASGIAVPVTGTFWPSTQPVSISNLPALSAGSNTIGAVTQSGTWSTGRTWSLTSASDSVTATISGTPSISGAVTANAGTNLNTSALALESGGNLAGINGKLTTSANGLKVDGSGATQPVSGSVSISGTPSVSISGMPVLGAGSSTIGKADILGSSGTSLDSAAGTSNAQAVTIQGNAGGIPVPVTGAFSATFGGFTPTPAYSVQNVTATTAAYSLPTGTVAIFYNTGSTAITVKLGGSGVSVVAGQADVIQPNSWMAFTAGTSTYYAVIGNGGASSVVVSGGSGLPTGAGGGGSGGSVTITSPKGSGTTPANAISITDTGTAGSGATICSGAEGIKGWLSCMYQAMTAAPTLGSTTGGMQVKYLIGINQTPQSVFTTAHQLYYVHCDNNNAAFSYLQEYDSTASPTPSAITTFDPLSPSMTDGFAVSLVGLQFTNGLWVTAATQPTGATAPVTSTINCTFGYK